MNIFLLLIILLSTTLFYPIPCFSETYWAKAYGGNNTENAYAIHQTIDSGFIVTGDTYSFGAGGDCWVIKLDNSGNVLWEKTYGGSNVELAQSIQQTADGGYVVAGRTYSFGSGNSDIWVLKLDSSGNVAWQKAYGGVDDDIGYFIQQTSDSGYIVSGITRSFGAGNWDSLILKLNHDGDISWQKTYGRSSSDLIHMIHQTSDSGYIMAGHTRSFGAGSYDYWVIKLDSSGNVSWQKTYGETGSDEALCIQQTDEGGYIVAGVKDYIEGVSGDFWVLKLDSSGSVIWQKAYGGSNEDYLYSIQQTSDGGYVAAGFTQSFGAGSYDYWVLKLDNTGNITWQKTYGGNGSDLDRMIRQTIDGGYIVAGRMFASGPAGNDWGVLKLDENGEIPYCDIIETSNAPLSNTSVSGGNTDVSGQDSFVSTLDTVVIPQDSSAAVNIICESVTLIELSSFYAYPSNKEVLLEWATESENDNAGFNLYRSESIDGKYVKINDNIISAEGSSTEGSFYAFFDVNVKNRKTYYYKLEDIDTNGYSTFHMPVSATPRFISGLGK